MRTVSFLCGSLALAAAAQAQDQSLTRTDADGNRTTITWGPSAPRADQGEPAFDVLDRDGDGLLSLTETEPHQLLHADFLYADSNRDHRLSRRELQRWIASDG